MAKQETYTRIPQTKLAEDFSPYAIYPAKQSTEQQKTKPSTVDYTMTQHEYGI